MTEKHPNFAYELQSALWLSVEFSNVYCEPQQICNLYVANVLFEHLITVEILPVLYLYFFITIRNAFVPVD